MTPCGKPPSVCIHWDRGEMAYRLLDSLVFMSSILCIGNVRIVVN